MTVSTHFSSILSSTNALTLVIRIVGLILFYPILSILYNLYFHSLSDYPGPRLAAATRLWYCWHCLRGNLPFVLDEAHRKYGDIVRIAPNELSYINPEAWNQIYGHKPGKPEIMKDPTFYSSISSGKGSIINAERSRHGHLRKQMSHGFSEKALREQEDAIRLYADLMIQRLKENCQENTSVVDMVSWYNFFTFDVMGELIFGQSFNCLQGSDYHPWVKLIFDSVKIGAFVRCSKYWPVLTPLIQRFIPAELQRRRMDQRQMAKEKAAYRKEIKDGRSDLISGFLKPDSGITDLEYQSTVETMVIAGSETTATLMSGATYYLLKNPDKMEKLVAEIRGAFSSSGEINFVSVNKLSYLLACLNEALRIYPPVPDAFPRNTGQHAETICGKSVPPNTVVRVTQWATFHSAKYFTRPDEYIPERWLDGQTGFEDDRKEALQPFHVGPRNCLGRNLAYVEMRLLIALVLWHFDLELCPVSNDWAKQKVFLLWEKPQLMVKLIPRRA
ncbi:cytochrome protein [Xylogone sp. PMI_703]|nr:cytochrome protein [Xylogone sp. PMI_703]